MKLKNIQVVHILNDAKFALLYYTLFSRISFLVYPRWYPPHAFHSSYKSQAVLPGELLLHHVSVPKPPIANSEGEFVIKK